MGLTIGSNRREVICSVGWDWDYSFLSLDEEGYPISHSSQSLTMDVIDEKGAMTVARLAETETLRSIERELHGVSAA